MSITADVDGDRIGYLDIGPRACSAYTDCASCAASRLCGWCGNGPNSIGNGAIKTAGSTGTSVVGTGTSFITQAGIAAGTLLTAGGQSRVVTHVHSETSLTIAAKFDSVLTGTASVYTAVGLDHVLGSRSTDFTVLSAGHTVTAGGSTRTVASVQSFSSFTVTTPWMSAGSSMQFTMGAITGSGTISSDAGSSVTITGSWPPSTSRFLTEIAAGVTITVGGVTRVVASVVSNQMLTVTAPFPEPFAGLLYSLGGGGRPRINHVHSRKFSRGGLYRYIDCILTRTEGWGSGDCVWADKTSAENL